MKKILWICAILCILTVTLFTGCSKKAEADPDKPVSLTVWCWDPNFNIYAMNEAAKIYGADHPNVTINVVETPWDDLQQKLITSLTANQTSSLPDIILMQDNALEKNLTNYPKAFLPVNDKIDLSQFAQYKVDYSKLNGKNYAVPFDNGATATFLRRDIVEKAGLKVSDFNDITWERFIELGKIIKQKTGVALVSMPQDGADFIMIMLQSSGTWFFDDAGKPIIQNNPVLKEALRLYKEMIDSGVCLQATDWNHYISTFNTGAVAATINGCWIIGSITGEKSQSGNWAVVNTPKLGTIPSSVNYSNQGGSSWMVMANSKNPEVAFDFLAKTFAGSGALYDTILPTSGAIGTWLPAAKTAAYSQPNAFFGGQKIYEDIINYAEDIPRIKLGVFNYEARDAVIRALYEVLKGTPIDTALATAQKTVEFQIGQ